MKCLNISACFLSLIGFISYASDDTLHLIVAKSINVTLPSEISTKLGVIESTSFYQVLFFDSEQKKQPKDVESRKELDQIMTKYQKDAKASSDLNKNSRGPDVPDSSIMSLLIYIITGNSLDQQSIGTFAMPGHYNHFSLNTKFNKLVEKTFVEVMKESKGFSSYIFTSELKHAQEKAQSKINEEERSLADITI